MTLKDKMKTYNFWISLVSACLLIARIIGDKFGFSIDSGLVMDITTGVCGIFVILGIISAPQKNSSEKGGVVVENTNQTTIAPNIVSYNDTFLKMQEKLQNNLKNIENMTQNVLSDEKSKDDELVVEVENLNSIDQIIGQNVETETTSQNLDVIVDTEEKIDDIVIEANTEDKTEDVINLTAVIESEETIVVQEEAGETQINCTINNTSKLDEFLSSLSAEELNKLKTMI